MKTIKLSRLFVTLLIMLAFWLSLSVSGCNTMEGAGRDIQSAGEGIEDAADDTAN